MMRYKGAVSDTDILLNLASIDRLEILEHLFKKIIIPWYVYDIEIKRNAGREYSKIVQAINKEGSIFEVKDRKKDKALNFLSKEIIAEKKMLIGPGESECAGYAYALRIPIIISDNYTEFKWLDEFITLTHRNILSLCVYFGNITKEEGVEMFNGINEQLTRPTENDFDYFYEKSMNRFRQHGWNSFLGIASDSS